MGGNREYSVHTREICTGRDPTMKHMDHYTLQQTQSHSCWTHGNKDSNQNYSAGRTASSGKYAP